MRYATVVMRPEGDSFHPLGRALAEESDLERVAIHQIEGLDDGTVAMLTEVHGDLDRYREILAESPHAIDYAVAGDREGICYVHVESTPLTDHLLQRGRETDFVVDYPIEMAPDGGHRFTLIGEDEAFRRAGRLPPDGVTMELVETGEYHPDARGLFARLTDRQREVVTAAVRLGYYENPRQATHEDLAREVGISPGTVGEHLRKAEARVFGELVE